MATLTKRRFRRRRRLIRRLKRDAAVAFLVVLFVVSSFILIKMIGLIASLFKGKPKTAKTYVEEAIVMTTATPSPTPIQRENLTILTPGEGKYYVLTFSAPYEKDVEQINIRSNPSAESQLLATIPTGSEFNVSAVYKDPSNSGFTGVIASEIGVYAPDGIAWVSSQYVDKVTHKYPWAVSTRDFSYTEKYGKSKVKVNTGISKDANLRSEPWESKDSSYGRVPNGTVVTASKVLVSSDQQWYGFPAEAFFSYFGDVRNDPDGIVWIYQAYCTINPVK